MEYKLEVDDIRSEYRPIINIIGLEQFIRLVEAYGGYQFYIPKSEAIYRNKRDEQIREEFDGYNFRSLAEKYGLTDRYIREIVSPILKQTRSRPMDGQVSLFEPEKSC